MFSATNQVIHRLGVDNLVSHSQLNAAMVKHGSGENDGNQLHNCMSGVMWTVECILNVQLGPVIDVVLPSSIGSSLLSGTFNAFRGFVFSYTVY